MGIYDNVKIACKNKGISINKLEQKLGFARSSISKFNTNIPSIEKVSKIAKELDVTVDYLMTGKELDEKEPALTPKDERDIQKKLNDTLNQLESQDGLMFDGEALDEETKELLKISIENAIRTAKITAKKKFTPKKYK